MRKNETQPGVQLLLSPSAIVRASTGVDEAELHRLVQKKVAEIHGLRQHSDVDSSMYLDLEKWTLTLLKRDHRYFL